MVNVAGAVVFVVVAAERRPSATAHRGYRFLHTNPHLSAPLLSAFDCNVTLLFSLNLKSITMSLDALKAEITSKRKGSNNDSISERPTKYMRRGELEKLKEEAERKKKEEQEAAKRKEQEEKDAARAKVGAKVSISSRSFRNVCVLKRVYLENSFLDPFPTRQCRCLVGGTRQAHPCPNQVASISQTRSQSDDYDRKGSLYACLDKRIANVGFVFARWS